jgi:small multidrug resistance pump
MTYRRAHRDEYRVIATGNLRRYALHPPRGLSVPWLMLTLAIVTEIIATTSLKYTDGFTKLVPSVITAAGYASAFWFLSIALREIPVSTAYAIWSGVGTATIAVIGMAFLGEPGGMLKTFGIALIVVGVVALNIAGNGH